MDDREQDKSTTPTPEGTVSAPSDVPTVDLPTLDVTIKERRAELGIREPVDHKPRYQVGPPMTEEELRAEREREAQEQIAEENARRKTLWCALAAERGERYMDCRLANFRVTCDEQKLAIEKLTKYCQNIKERIRSGAGLVLFGPRGTGKDHLAMAVCCAAIKAGFRVRWQNGMDLFGDVRDSFDDGGPSEADFVKRLAYPDVLYLSDPIPPFGALSQFQASMLFRVLDARYSRRKPLVCTINVSGGQELNDRIGAQNADRIRDGALAIFCNWESNRKASEL